MNRLWISTLLALTLGLGGCPTAPTAKDQKVRCSSSSDCDALNTAFGTDFVCNTDLGLCVTAIPAGDGGTTCDPACAGTTICRGGACVDPGSPEVKIAQPVAGAGVIDSVTVVAQVVPGLAAVETVNCQLDDGSDPMPADPRPTDNLWDCNLPVGGDDGPRRVTVTAEDLEGRIGQAQVEVVRDTLPPRVEVSLFQRGVGPISAVGVWPTDGSGHGPLEVTVVVTEANLPPGNVTVELPRRNALPAFFIPVDCTTLGDRHTCVGSHDLKPTDFATVSSRGPQNIFATATDVAGHQGEGAADFDIDDRAPELTNISCSGEQENGGGQVLRDSTLHCLVDVSDRETGLAGDPTATLASLPASFIVVLPTTGAGWAIELKLPGHPFPAFQTSLDVGLSAADVWGNSAGTTFSVSASRHRWQVNLGGQIFSPALAPDGLIHAAVSVSAGDASLVQIDPLTGVVQSTIDLNLDASDELLAGPVVQVQSSGRSVSYLLASNGSLLKAGDSAGTLLAAQAPWTIPGTTGSYRSLPVISASGDWAYAVVSRTDANTAAVLVSLEAVGASYSGSGSGCSATSVPSYLEFAEITAYTLPMTDTTVLYAADQGGDAVFGTCTGCNCETFLELGAPLRWSGLAAYTGGFLYPAAEIMLDDRLEWGAWDPAAGDTAPVWSRDRLHAVFLTGGPVHDGNGVYVGTDSGAQGDSLIRADLLPPYSTIGANLGSTAVLDLVLADNGEQWVLHQSANAIPTIANVALESGTSRWSGALEGTLSYALHPEFDRPGMLLEPNTRSLIVPHGTRLTSVAVDAQLGSGWPMSKADVRRSACLP